VVLDFAREIFEIVVSASVFEILWMEFRGRTNLKFCINIRTLWCFSSWLILEVVLGFGSVRCSFFPSIHIFILYKQINFYHHFLILNSKS
jgi:hypothetical protein